MYNDFLWLTDTQLGRAFILLKWPNTLNFFLNVHLIINSVILCVLIFIAAVFTVKNRIKLEFDRSINQLVKYTVLHL